MRPLSLLLVDLVHQSRILRYRPCLPRQACHRMESDSAKAELCRQKARILWVKASSAPAPWLTIPDLSLEFLMGRAMDNAMLNVGMKDVARGERSICLIR